jgi:hypothetical protein
MAREYMGNEFVLCSNWSFTGLGSSLPAFEKIAGSRDLV